MLLWQKALHHHPFFHIYSVTILSFWLSLVHFCQCHSTLLHLIFPCCHLLSSLHHPPFLLYCLQPKMLTSSIPPLHPLSPSSLPICFLHQRQAQENKYICISSTHRGEKPLHSVFSDLMLYAAIKWQLKPFRTSGCPGWGHRGS